MLEPPNSNRLSSKLLAEDDQVKFIYKTYLKQQLLPKCLVVTKSQIWYFLFVSDSVKKLQDQKHDMEKEIKTLHRRLRVSKCSSI